ncbi:MAG: hypothetical protein NZ534_06480 [Bacteroidia bacterium]|nr:hypothetical protein [Bacteroidia bacterium]
MAAGWAWCVLTGCGESDPLKRMKVARFKDETLTQRDIKDAIAKFNVEDSVAFARAFIEEWIREKAILENARKLPKDVRQKVEKMTENYRNKLLVYEIQQAVIRENLKTGVTQAEIEAYYRNNRNAYLAEKNYYNYRYVKTANPNVPQFYDRLASKLYGDQKVVREWCAYHAAAYKLDSSYTDAYPIRAIEIETGMTGLLTWPLRAITMATTVSGNQRYFHYFVMMDVIKQGTPKPLHMVRNTIRQNIMEMRIDSLLRRYDAQILEQAKALKYID